MSDTPETDEIVQAYHDQRESVGGIIEHAESLERERDEARGIAAFYRSRSCESQEEYDDHKFSWENA
jgi:hypothetical protein